MYLIWLHIAMAIWHVMKIADSQNLEITCIHIYERKTASGRLDCYSERMTHSPSLSWEDDTSLPHVSWAGSWDLLQPHGEQSDEMLADTVWLPLTSVILADVVRQMLVMHFCAGCALICTGHHQRRARLRGGTWDACGAEPHHLIPQLSWV